MGTATSKPDPFVVAEVHRYAAAARAVAGQGRSAFDDPVDDTLRFAAVGISLQLIEAVDRLAGGITLSTATRHTFLLLRAEVTDLVGQIDADVLWVAVTDTIPSVLRDLTGEVAAPGWDAEKLRGAITALRGIVYQRNGEGLMSLLSEDPWPSDCLQLLGDGLAAAIRDEVAGAVPLAERCVVALRAREWRGDEELATVLTTLLAAGEPDLKPIPIDLEELADCIEGDPNSGGGQINLRTGMVYPQDVIDNLSDELGVDEDGEPEGDWWLPFWGEGSRDGYRDMEWFIDDLEDKRFADQLTRAIEGRGACRRFRDRLYDRENDGMVTRWQAFSNDRHRGRARHWLARHGYRPTI